MWFKRKGNLTEYPLIVEWDTLRVNVQRYKLRVYSNHKPLTFILDSGSERGLILPEAVSDCAYCPTGQSSTLVGIGGSSPTEDILLMFDFNENTSSAENSHFGLDFDIIHGQSAQIFKSYGVDGLLGANFLQFCIVDYRKGIVQL